MSCFGPCFRRLTMLLVVRRWLHDGMAGFSGFIVIVHPSHRLWIMTGMMG
jgi:hypothetical protein